MEFARLAEQQVFERVRDSTTRVRDGQVPDPVILDYLRQQGIDIRRSVFPFLGELDERLYNGTVVSQNRRVFEFVVDANDPGECSLDDVTDQLGPKDPKHPRSDVKDVITMSLAWFDHGGA
jgi:hypothetical protein